MGNTSRRSTGIEGKKMSDSAYIFKELPFDKVPDKLKHPVNIILGELYFYHGEDLEILKNAVITVMAEDKD